MFFSVYGLPNLLLCFFSGNIFHKLGLRLSNILFFGLQTLGHALFIYSLSTHSYALALVGRLLVGIGGEFYQCIFVNFTHVWFKHKEQGMASSFMFVAFRGSVAVVDLFLPYIYKETGSVVIT